jgi:hypothetical protein
LAIGIALSKTVKIEKLPVYTLDGDGALLMRLQNFAFLGQFLSQHPELPSFIIQETNRESDIAHDNFGFFQKISNTGIFQQCLEAQQRGEMREINIFNLTLLIISNCHYPFMSRNMLKGMLKLDDSQLIPNIEIHKKHVSDLLIAYLFPKISNNE